MDEAYRAPKLVPVSVLVTGCHDSVMYAGACVLYQLEDGVSPVGHKSVSSLQHTTGSQCHAVSCIDETDLDDKAISNSALT